MSTPPGIEPNYIDPPDHRRQQFILHSIFLILITGAITIRAYTRLRITKSFGLDDYIAVFAWAASVTWSAISLESVNYGIGRHLWDIPADWLITGLRYLKVMELLYLPTILAVKLSFFVCFDRIFGSNNRKTRYFTWFGIISNIVFYIIVFLYTIFLCKPVARFWNPKIPGTCGSTEGLPYATGIWGFLSDFYIFILPIPCVWSLNMKLARKIKLTAAFSVGLFACMTTIIRFAFTVKYVNDVDATWNYIQLNVWTVLEVDVGLICSCLLSFPAFFRYHKPSNWDSYVSHISSYILREQKSQTSDRTPLHELKNGSSGVEEYAMGKVAIHGGYKNV